MNLSRLSNTSNNSKQAALRSGWDTAHTIILSVFLLIAAAWHVSSNAAELGRLFYTPQQRTQLETQLATGAVTDGGKPNYIMVNGVIQKRGGKRIVWINGTQQAESYGNEKTPATVSVNVPGKSQPVQTKVGQRVLLSPAAPESE